MKMARPLIVANGLYVPHKLQKLSYPGRVGDIEAMDCDLFPNIHYTCHWVWAHFAFPHTDDDQFPGLRFITLSCTPGYQLFDLKHYTPGVFGDNNFSPGELAIIEPETTHWLEPDISGMRKIAKKYWTGIQWLVPTRSVHKAIAKIVDHLGGAMTTDYRYYLKEKNGKHSTKPSHA